MFACYYAERHYDGHHHKKTHFYIFIKTFWEKKPTTLSLARLHGPPTLETCAPPFHLFKYQPRGCFHCHSSDTAGLTCISSNESCFLSPKYRHSRWLLISSSHAKSSLLSSLSFLTCL